MFHRSLSAFNSSLVLPPCFFCGGGRRNPKAAHDNCTVAFRKSDGPHLAVSIQCNHNPTDRSTIHIRAFGDKQFATKWLFYYLLVGPHYANRTVIPNERLVFAFTSAPALGVSSSTGHSLNTVAVQSFPNNAKESTYQTVLQSTFGIHNPGASSSECVVLTASISFLTLAAP